MSETYDLTAHDPRPKAQDGVEMPLLDPAGTALDRIDREPLAGELAHRRMRLDEHLRRSQ